MPSPAAIPAPPATRPRPQAAGYAVHSLLGQGSFGTVWRATQQGTLREVALKFSTPWTQQGPSELRFAREAEIGASLEHPHIARVFDRGSDADGAWLAMELVEGSHLDAWVAAQNPTLSQKMTLFRQICEGVLHAHQRGVIHRDLKPSNVLVTPDGTPKIVDFGLACWERASSLDVTMTRQGEVFGSLAWMPPEQAAGQGPEVDALSDVYALGALLFSLVAGRPPLDHTLALPALLAAAQTGERPRLRTLQTDAPKDIAAIADKCLSLEKTRRYQSSAQLRDDVARWLAGDPVQARSTAPFYWIRRKIKRHRKPALGFALATLGVGWTYFDGRAKVAQSQRQAAAKEAAQTAQTLREAQEIITRLLLEMPSKPGGAANLKWAEDARHFLAAFPWSLSGGSGTYDQRPFRARTALAVARDQSSKRRWDTALPRWREASQDLQTLAADHPEVPAYLADLGSAKIGEGETLLALGHHRDAIQPARDALAALTPPPGSPPPDDATLTALAKLAGHLVKDVLAANGNLAETAPFVASLIRLIPSDPPLLAAHPQYDGWLAELACQQVALTLRLHGPAAAAAPATAAVHHARQYYARSDQGELAGGTLATALAAQANIATERDEAAAAQTSLTEASEILSSKKSRSERTTLFRDVYKQVAASWTRLAAWQTARAALADAIAAHEEALKLYAAMNRMNPSDTSAMLQSARLFLQNARLSQQIDQSASALRCAKAAAFRFAAIAEKRPSQDGDFYADQAEAAILMVELKAPAPENGPPWAATASLALRRAAEITLPPSPQWQARLEPLQARLASPIQ